MSKRIATAKDIQIKSSSSKEEFLMESLKVIADGIAGTFGSRCEVVIHDVRDLNKLGHSIVKIINGNVTGRAIGGPISDRGLRDFRSGIKQNLVINYPSVGKEGNPLKSTSIILRDESGKPIAALGINFDLTDIVNLNRVLQIDIAHFSSAIQEIFTTSDLSQRDETAETFADNGIATLNDLADKLIRKAGRAVPSMRRKDRMEIVRQLESQGFFLLKGAVQVLAQKLTISNFAVYKYLKQIRSASSEPHG